MKSDKVLTILLAAGLLGSCGVPREISYFQETAEEDKVIDVTPTEIHLQPEDKITIIVNCKDPQLASLFNLPYIQNRVGQTSDYNVNYSMGMSAYTIDSEGNIDFPILGQVKIGGLTREEVCRKIKDELTGRNLVKDPVVTVEFINLNFSVLGEVARPGRYNISRDHLTILDAIAMAGDLTINGTRGNVRVIRQIDNTKMTYRVNLCSIEDVMSSPVYYLRQNDMIYVEPNDVRARQSTVNGNNVLSTSFWISVASLAATVVSTISVVSIRSK